MALTILQTLIAVLQVPNNLEKAFQILEIDHRGGWFSEKMRYQSLSWDRGEWTDHYYKVDKKGRLFVAKKYGAIITWSIRRSDKRPTLHPGVIQVNVLKSNSKRGGWLIRTHVQTAILAKNNKIQFHGKWIGYWASDAMVENGLMAKASSNKFGKAILINSVTSCSDVLRAIEMIKKMQNVEAIN